MSEVLDPIIAPIDVSIDLEARRANLKIEGLVESVGTPIINPHDGREVRSRIHLPNGFEYTYAEMGNGTSTARTGIELNLTDSYGQFNVLHMNQDGVIRQSLTPVDSPRQNFPRRDLWAILTGLAGVTTLAWIYLFLLAAEMGAIGSDMSETMEIRSWTGTDFLLMFLTWTIMMVPSAIPTTLVYAAVARKAAAQDSTVAPVFVFIAGYIGMWLLFSAGATVVQWMYEQADLLSPMMVSRSPYLGAGLLIAAGAYQLTPMKDSCLEHCRAPAHFFSEHWHPGWSGALRMGAEHGAYCLGCCWVLMGLLFLGGVMNLLWIAAIAAFVLLEKVLPLGDRGGRVAGVAMILLGAATLAGFGLF